MSAGPLAAENFSKGPIVVAGAGSVGCFVGGVLQAAGKEVIFLGRQRLAGQIASHGMRLTDFAALDATLPADAVRYETDPATALQDSALILVAVKSGATQEMAQLIAAHAPQNAVIISLQNGVGNAGILRAALPGRRVLAGMVPYNIVQMGEGRFHRGTGGALTIEAGVDGLTTYLTAPGLTVAEERDIEGILWGKLLINLNNALNALSGLKLKDQFETWGWRRILADQMSEALAALKTAGVTPKAALPIAPEKFPTLLRLPNFIFRIVARRMTTIDPEARSSMWEDLDQRRMTEIGELQGAVVQLANANGLKAPLNARVAALIRQAEAAKNGSPKLTPKDVRGAS